MKRVAITLALTLAVVIAGPFATREEAQAAATTLWVSQSCSATPDRVTVSFSWAGNDPAAVQQWVDLSLFDNGWVWETFLGAGPLAPEVTTLTWDGLIPNATHYVRVNQELSPGSWDPSATFVFTTMGACSTAFSLPSDSSDGAGPPVTSVSTDGPQTITVTAGVPGLLAPGSLSSFPGGASVPAGSGSTCSTSGSIVVSPDGIGC
jgi:hypothetical protein